MRSHTERIPIPPKASPHSGSRIRVLLIALAAIVATGVAAGTAWRTSAPTRDTSAGLADVAGLQAGRPAPAFAIPALNGGHLTLAQYGGHPRLVSFFASWCVECWNDMRVLERAYEQYERQGLVIMGVGAHDTADSLHQMTARLHITFPTGYDPNGELVARPYHLYSIPTTVFVGADGVIKAVVQGRVHTDTLQQYLPLILPAAASAQ